MRVAVVSDVHANLPALEAVLAEVDAAGVDEVWCLGDVVGYGPDPGPCVDIIRDRCAVSLAGNHDLGAIGAIPIDDFNPYAAEANLWTGSVLSGADRAWLGSLRTRDGAAGRDAGAWKPPRAGVGIRPVGTAWRWRASSCFETQWCLVGHSHVPMVIVEPAPGGKLDAFAGSPGPVEPPGRAIINPGSVGQPRDGDPRAAYAILDLEGKTATFCRAAYDVAQVQERMRKAGLPSYLIDRLERGR